jgi:glycosyltransferase involved in cell wall biosynthesis
MKDRAFVLDPVCALPYGHNVVGLKYIADALKPYFRNVMPIASLSLPSDIARKYGFERAFEFYYHEHIKLPSVHENAARRTSVRNGSDVMRDAAVRDMATIFEKYALGENDAVVFPCVDYYGGISLLELLSQRPAEKAPVVYLRFIGVMENATAVGVPGMPRLAKQLKIALSRGYQIKLSAETPRYADKLADDLDTVVGVVSWPLHSDLARPTTSDAMHASGERSKAFTIACPGSARLDKGYLLLREIFGAIRRRDPEISIKFITQGLPIADALNHSAYTNQLYAIPGVKLLPSTLSEEQINDVYERTDLALLPYDPEIYAFRGSAIFMECLSRGIPVIALAGSGFCDQINYFGAGSVVPDAASVTEEIFKYRDMPKRSVINRMHQARYRYSIDADFAFSHWLAQ